MEGGRKRPGECLREHGTDLVSSVGREEEDDDEKVDMLFEILRRIRAVNDCWRSKKQKLEKQVWVPSFQMEDFVEEIEFKNPPTQSSSSNNRLQQTLSGSLSTKSLNIASSEKEAEKQEKLDLNLSL